MRGDRTGNTERSGQHMSCWATPHKSGSEVTHWLSRNSGGVRALPVKMKNWECTECGDGRLERSAHCGAARAFDSDRSHWLLLHWPQKHLHSLEPTPRRKESQRHGGGMGVGRAFCSCGGHCWPSTPTHCRRPEHSVRTAVAPEPTSALSAARADMYRACLRT